MTEEEAEAKAAEKGSTSCGAAKTARAIRASLTSRTTRAIAYRAYIRSGATRAYLGHFSSKHEAALAMQASTRNLTLLAERDLRGGLSKRTLLAPSARRLGSARAQRRTTV